jgi:hypothetical protein
MANFDSNKTKFYFQVGHQRWTFAILWQPTNNSELITFLVCNGT